MPGIVWRIGANGKKKPYVRLYIHGRQRLFTPPQPTLTSARALYDKLKVEYRDGRLNPERYQRAHGEFVSDVIDRYLEDAKKKKSHRDDLRYAGWWSAYLKGRRLPTVTALDIQKARAVLSRSGRLGSRTLSTVNRHVSWFRRVCSVEVLLGHLHKNPCAGVPMPKEPPSPPIIVDPALEQRIYDILGSRACWAEFAILTGLREHEQFSIRKEWIRREHRLLVIPDPKAGDPQTLAISDRAMEIIDHLCAQHPTSPWLFPHHTDSTRHMDGRYWYSRIFKPALIRAGIPIGRKVGGIVWHTLRHTFGTRLALLGANEYDLMEAGRWKSPATPRRYVHLNRKRTRDILERLARFAQTSAPTDEHPSSSAGTGVRPVT